MSVRRLSRHVGSTDRISERDDPSFPPGRFQSDFPPDFDESPMRRFAGWMLFVCLVATTPVRAEEVSLATPQAAAPSYREDVTPVFTRFGCNMGACHGKLVGQNGFKLSLRGYAPEMDHTHLMRDDAQRRINRLDAEQSLLLLKPAGGVPHGGGIVLREGSPGYRILADWVRAGMPGPIADEPRVVRLEVSPAEQTLKPGDTLQLAATAHYADGRTRDVTWLARFDSNDAGMVSVSATGKVEALRHGETVVRVAFQDQVEIVHFRLPSEKPVDESLFAERRNVVDEHVFDKLKSLRIPPSPPCDDAAFLRRVSLDLTGTLPTPDDVRAFLADTSADKREKLVDSLFERPEFTDFWTLQFGDLLQNRRERDHDVRGQKGVRSFQAWLRSQVAANRPWNELARDVLTAKGSVVENPAVGYFLVTVGERSPEQSEVADSVAQAFLGTRIGCARCHNHPLERYTQDDYYHFVAFFSRVALERKSPMEGMTLLHLGTNHTLNLGRQIAQEREKLDKLRAEKPDLKPDDKQFADLEKRIADLEKQKTDALAAPVQVGQPRTGKPMLAQPLDRSPVDIPGGGDPRTALVDWMVRPDNGAFPGAMVNRLWRHFLGTGLVEPVDDLRATNPPSNQPLWNALRHEFVSGGYDVRRLMRLIVTSRAYQLSSRTLPENAADTRYASHYQARRLPAEVLLDAINQTTGLPDAFPGYPLGLRAIQLPGPQTDSYFLSLFGRSDRVTACACERNPDVTLPQLLHLQNDNGIAQKLQSGEGRLQKLLASTPDDDRLTDELYLLTIGRAPSNDQRQAFREHLAKSESRKTAFEDLFWALLNAKEFVFNH